MGYQFVGFLAFTYVGMTLVNRILEGAFIKSADIAVVNQISIFRPASVFGLFEVTVPNIAFFSGLGRLVKWDYAFFGGNAGIIQYFLYSFTTALAFILLVVMIGMASQAIGRLR